MTTSVHDHFGTNEFVMDRRDHIITDLVLDRYCHGTFPMNRNSSGPKWSWAEVDDHFGPRTDVERFIAYYHPQLIYLIIL